MSKISKLSEPTSLQRSYYERTADAYDRMHPLECQHQLALHLMLGACRNYAVRSILEVGSGSGRVLNEVGKFEPSMQRIGIEPSLALLKRPSSTADTATLVAGDGNQLPLRDATVDMACAFAVLHHVPDPRQVLSEMLRVARVGIFVSDSNNFGQGGALTRRLKQWINALGLWPLANWIRTRGRGWQYSEGDGVFYSFSVFSQVPWISEMAEVHLVNLDGGAFNPYAQSGTVGMLAIKRK